MIRRLRHAVALLLLAAGLTAYAAERGDVLLFNLVTEDAEAANAFYADLFGWRMEARGDGYVAYLGEQPMAAISPIDGQLDDVEESVWLPLIVVRDLFAALRTTQRAGGSIEQTATRTPDWGSYAVIRDPEQNVVVLGVPERDMGGAIGAGSWVWAELWTEDPDGAADFYSRLLGYERQTTELGELPYDYFTRDGQARAGLVRIPMKGIKPSWAPYIGVDDVRSVSASTQQLGGRLLLGPSESRVDGRVARLADPTGAAFFVFGFDGEAAE